MVDKMNILFVCKYNQFRSKIAEAYFKKINKNIKAKSAGIIKNRFTNKTEKKMAKIYGLYIKERTNQINSDLLNWANIIVIVADNVPKSLFDKKVIKFNIKEAKEDDKEGIKKEIELIIKKITKLNEKLKKEKIR